MEVQPELICPHCGYKTIYWRKRSGSYNCQKCGKSSSRQMVIEYAQSKM
ncbi:MAG: hypothetical protein WC998_09470 [Candidatus Paceibacterota bacterium]